MHEKVRKFVRGQQILGFIGSRNQKPDILKRNQALWGNNPQETESVQVQPGRFTKFGVKYFKRDMASYWRESKFSKQLTEIFVQMIRDTWTAVPHEILYSNVVDSLIPLVDLVKLYCAHSETINVGTAKKPDMRTRTSVPSKPKESPLLLREEQAIINELAAPLFGKTFFEDNIQDWPLFLLGSGFRNVLDDLQSQYSARGVFVRNFAQLTTNRLGQIRNLPDVPKDLKKKDCKPERVAEIILLRQDAVDSFVDEVMHLDPQFNGFLSVWISGRQDLPNLDTSSPDFRSSIRTCLSNLCVEKGLYQGLTRTVDQLHAWSKYYDNLSEIAQKRVELVRDFKRLLQLKSQPKLNYTKKRYVLDEFMSHQQMERERQFNLNKRLGKLKEETEKPAILTIERPSDDILTEAHTRKADMRTEAKKKEDFRLSTRLNFNLEDLNGKVEKLKRHLERMKQNPVDTFNELARLWKHTENIDTLEKYLLVTLILMYGGVDMSNTDFPYTYNKYQDRTGKQTITAIFTQFNNLKATWQPKAVLND
jgi:hypothetical protein